MPRPHSRLDHLAALVRLGRPKFLLGGFALYGLGALAARVSGHAFDWPAYALGQLAITSIQLMTHYSNDYFDYEADRANPNPTPWSGGSRVLVEGQLPRGVGLYAALSMALLTWVVLACVARSLPHGSWRLVTATFVLLQLLAWSYSSPPLSLHSRGLGEPCVAITVPLLTPLSGFVVQSGELRAFPVLLSVPLALLLICMLLTLQFPDEIGDRAVGKRTWVVIFGTRRVARLCAVLIACAFALSFAGAWLGLPKSVSLAWLFLLPLGVYQIVRTLAHDGQRRSTWERLEFGSVALFFLAVVLDLAALASI